MRVFLPVADILTTYSVQFNVFFEQDILFGLVKKFFIKRIEKSPKVVIMSATLNHQKFSDFLDGCPVIEIPGKVYPVKEVYCDYIGTRDLQTPNYLNKVQNCRH